MFLCIYPHRGELFQAGALEINPISTLHDDFTSISLNQPTSGLIPIEIRTNDGSSFARHAVDVAVLQSNPLHNRSLFQAASNFNGVEAISCESAPNGHNFITDYWVDRTQGPRASIGCASAAIFRVLFPFKDQGKEAKGETHPSQPVNWDQRKNRQLNLLFPVHQFIPVENGYAILSPDCLPLPKEDTQEYDSLIKSCQSIVHRYSEVTFCGDIPQAGYNTTSDKSQTVDQIFCAALNIGQEQSGFLNRRSPDIENKVRFCQKVAYDSTYLAAFTGKNPLLFLTMIGCGVFDNNPSTVVQVIVNSHMQYAKITPQTQLKKVIIPLFTPNSNSTANEIVALCKKNKIPVRWVHYQADKMEPTVVQQHE